jgi:hypothetical protein
MEEIEKRQVSRNITGKKNQDISSFLYKEANITNSSPSSVPQHLEGKINGNELRKGK